MNSYVCEICGKSLELSEGCSTGKIYINGIMYKRIPVFGRMKNGRCVDCNARYGMYHHWGCDQEICPACGGQLLSCSCEDIGVEEEESSDQINSK